MKVIHVQRKKQYALITFEDNITVLADPGYIERFAVSAGSDIDHKACLQENESFAAQYAMDSALNYLSFAARTEKQLRDYLKQKNIPSSIIEPLILKLKDYRYIDDVSFAQTYTADAISYSKGKQYIRSKLKQKGIDETQLNQALELYAEEDERNNAALFIDKQYQLLKRYPPTERKEKIFRKAVAQGFPSSMVRDILYTYTEDNSQYNDYFIQMIDKKCNFYKNKGLLKNETILKIYAALSAKGVSRDLISERVDDLYE